MVTIKDHEEKATIVNKEGEVAVFETSEEHSWSS